MRVLSLTINPIHFIFLCPNTNPEAYWEEIEEGAMKACEARRDFHIDVKSCFTNDSDNESFMTQYTECLNSDPDGVIIVHGRIELIVNSTNILHEKKYSFYFT